MYTAIKQHIGFINFAIGVLLIAVMTNNCVPTGGVIPPIMFASTNTHEKCNGLIPIAVAIGNIIGPKRSIVAVASTKHPAIKHMRILNSRNKNGVAM